VEPQGGDDDPTVMQRPVAAAAPPTPLVDPTVVQPSPAPEPPPAPPQTPAAAPSAPAYVAPAAAPPTPASQPAYATPPAYAPQPAYAAAPVYAAPAPHHAAVPRPTVRRGVAATLVLTGSALFAWYFAGVAANLGVDVVKPSVFIELAGPRVFLPAALVCLVLGLWVRVSRSVAAGLITTLVGAGLVAYAVWDGSRDIRFLIGSVPLAAASLVLLGGLAGLRRRR
jgi:hypothetical protein